MSEEVAKTCLACGSENQSDNPHLKCARCKSVYYCSKECQRKDWPIHTLTCVPKSTNIQIWPGSPEYWKLGVQVKQRIQNFMFDFNNPNDDSFNVLRHNFIKQIKKEQKGEIENQVVIGAVIYMNPMDPEEAMKIMKSEEEARKIGGENAENFKMFLRVVNRNPLDFLIVFAVFGNQGDHKPEDRMKTIIPCVDEDKIKQYSMTTQIRELAKTMDKKMDFGKFNVKTSEQKEDYVLFSYLILTDKDLVKKIKMFMKVGKIGRLVIYKKEEGAEIRWQSRKEMNVDKTDKEAEAKKLMKSFSPEQFKTMLIVTTVDAFVEEQANVPARSMAIRPPWIDDTFVFGEE